jgi:hypothetical protein
LRERTGLQSGIAALTSLLGVVSRERGDLGRAEEALRHGVALWTRLGVPQAVAWVDNDLGAALCRRGELAAAEECHQRSRLAQERLGDQRGLLRCWIGLAEVACARGDGHGVAAYCRHARRLARRQGNHFMETMALLLEVQAWLQVSHARSRLRASAVVLAWVQVLVRTHSFTAEGIQFASVRTPAMQLTLLKAQLHLQQGALDEASAAAAAVEHWAQAEGRRYEQALAQRLLGQCALDGADPSTAAEYLRAALAEQVGCDAALEAAHTRLVLAAALESCPASGSASAEARRLWEEAHAQFTASGALLVG